MNQLSSSESSAKLKRQELKSVFVCDTALKLGRAAAPEKATVLLAFPLFYNGAIDSDLIMVEEYSSSSLFLTLADLF